VEESVQRLERILGAVESDQARRASPKTVERAMLGRLGGEEREDVQGEPDAAMCMRARLARDLLAAAAGSG
jgi:hypothetical protein